MIEILVGLSEFFDKGLSKGMFHQAFDNASPRADGI